MHMHSIKYGIKEAKQVQAAVHVSFCQRKTSNTKKKIDGINQTKLSPEANNYARCKWTDTV